MHTEESWHRGSTYTERNGQKRVRGSPFGNTIFWYCVTGTVCVLALQFFALIAELTYEIRIKTDLQYMQGEEGGKDTLDGWQVDNRASVHPCLLVTVFFWCSFDYVILMHPHYLGWTYILWCNNTPKLRFFNGKTKKNNLWLTVLEL